MPLETSEHLKTNQLFVAWQDRNSNQYHPVGVLAKQNTSPQYTFRYLRGVKNALADGFRPFAEFSNIAGIYQSNSLFYTFSNRLMSRNRSDFRQHVHRLGLDTSADDFEVLARSGGRRSTDSVELFPMPQQNADGEYETYFLVHGIRHLPESAQITCTMLSAGDQLLLMSDFQNPYDESALVLRTESKVIVGYLPRYLLSDCWTLIRLCGWIRITIQQVNSPPSPVQQRILCRVNSCWPANFKPFNSDEYEHLVSNFYTD